MGPHGRDRILAELQAQRRGFRVQRGLDHRGGFARVAVLGLVHGAGKIPDITHAAPIRLGLRHLPQRAASERCPECPGLDDQDLDAQRTDFLRQRLGHSLQGEFRRGVGAEPGERQLAAHGGDVDDRADPLRPRRGQGGLNHRNRTEEHRLHDRSEFGHRGFLDGAHDAVAGVVDQDVDTSEPSDGGPDGGVGLVRAGDIQFQRQHAVGRLLNQRRKPRGVPPRGDHPVALLKGVRREGKAES
jgi:hypothetical protein